MHCMNADLSDLLRLLQNLIRLGTIAEVKGAKARVRLGPTLTTEWLKWATRRAGSTRTWPAPTVGEQVIVFSPGGDLTRGIILPALYSQEFDAPESSDTLPKLSRKMEEYRAGGMSGPVSVDFGNEALSLEWSAGGLIAEALKQYGAHAHGAVQLRFAGAYQEDDDGTVAAVEVVVRGRYKEIDMGGAKMGDDTTHKYTMACSYYKLMIDGATGRAPPSSSRCRMVARSRSGICACASIVPGKLRRNWR